MLQVVPCAQCLFSSRHFLFGLLSACTRAFHNATDRSRLPSRFTTSSSMQRNHHSSSRTLIQPRRVDPKSRPRRKTGAGPGKNALEPSAPGNAVRARERLTCLLKRKNNVIVPIMQLVLTLWSHLSHVMEGQRMHAGWRPRTTRGEGGIFAWLRPRATRSFCFGKRTQNHGRPSVALRVPLPRSRRFGLRNSLRSDSPRPHIEFGTWAQPRLEAPRIWRHGMARYNCKTYE